MTATDQLVKIPASSIRAGANDRQVFDSADLEGLAESIRRGGLAQPVTVRPVPGGFEIVAGERRTRAMRDVLGWTEIPCLVRELDDDAASAIMLAENVARADLDPMAEARAYRKRLDELGWSEKDLAARAGVTVDRVRRRLSLLDLRADAVELVARGTLPIGHAEALTRPPLDADRQSIALREWRSHALTVEAMRGLCDRLRLEQDQESMFSLDALTVESFVNGAQLGTTSAKRDALRDVTAALADALESAGGDARLIEAARVLLAGEHPADPEHVGRVGQCRKGHLLTPDNVTVSHGRRECRRCRAARAKDRYHAQRALTADLEPAGQLVVG